MEERLITVRHREVCERLHDEVVWQDPGLEFGQHLLHHFVDEALPHCNEDIACCLLPLMDYFLSQTNQGQVTQSSRT